MWGKYEGGDVVGSWSKKRTRKPAGKGWMWQISLGEKGMHKSGWMFISHCFLKHHFLWMWETLGPEKCEENHHNLGSEPDWLHMAPTDQPVKLPTACLLFLLWLLLLFLVGYVGLPLELKDRDNLFLLVIFLCHLSLSLSLAFLIGCRCDLLKFWDIGSLNRVRDTSSQTFPYFSIVCIIQW